MQILKEWKPKWHCRFKNQDWTWPGIYWVVYYCCLTSGFALSSYAETTLIKYWVTGRGWERERGEGCEMFGVFGDSWETAHSSFSQNMQWAQHNILKTDKIPFHHPSSLSFFWVTIDSLSLSDHRSRRKGSHETHTHKHTHHFLKHTGTHQVSCGNLFSNQLSAITCLRCCGRPHAPASITSLKHHRLLQKVKGWKIGWKTWWRGRLQGSTRPRAEGRIKWHEIWEERMNRRETGKEKRGCICKQQDEWVTPGKSAF